MPNQRNKTLVGKGLHTVVCILILAGLCVSTNDALATCQSSEKCDNEISASSVFFDKFSNSTLFLDQFSNATLLLNEFSNSTLFLDQFSNATYFNETLPIPADSFLSSKTNSTGNTKQTAGSLQLHGSQYLDEHSIIRTPKSLTVSAWIRPDYGQGSSVFTVVSDENAFVLAVNNNMPPSKVAVFSIFDGIKWTTVQSASHVSDQWTHLAATFNGTTIEIYMNGNLEKTAMVAAVPALVDGELRTQAMQNLTSGNDVTIGAYYENARMRAKDLFSGDISNVNLYDTLLTQKQIYEIFHDTRPN